jgi:hypothetical protein
MKLAAPHLFAKWQALRLRGVGHPQRSPVIPKLGPIAASCRAVFESDSMKPFDSAD